MSSFRLTDWRSGTTVSIALSDGRRVELKGAPLKNGVNAEDDPVLAAALSALPGFEPVGADEDDKGSDDQADGADPASDTTPEPDQEQTA